MMAERFVSKVKALPAFSATVAKLSAMVNDDRSSVQSITEVLRVDPGITGNMLRLANSAAFRGRSEITSVNEAITRLGIKRVVEVAVGGWFRSTIPGKLPLYEEGSEAFWSHSVSTAVYAERISKVLNRARESAFTAGLMHDVGKIVIAVVLAEDLDRVRGKLKEGATLIDAEREILQTDHTEVGLGIAERWKLPSAMADAIRWHHDPLSAPEGTGRDLAGIVHIASCMSHSFGFGADVGGLQRSMSPAALTHLGLRRDQMALIAAESLDEINSISKTLSGGKKKS